MSARVRALVWTGDGDFALHERPLPEPGPGEVLVRVTAAAICGSDRHTVAGRRASPHPGILGHEGVGAIVALGAGTRAARSDAAGGAAPEGGSAAPDGGSAAPEGGSAAATGGRSMADPARTDAPAVDLDGAPLACGDRIVWSVISSCGSCDRCRAGHTAKCRRLRKAGHEALDSSWPLSGTYATHVLLPAGHDVVRVGAETGDAAAALAACAGATVMAVLDAAGNDRLAGARVLVNGVGMLGLLAVVAARAAGAGDVHAVDPSSSRRALALRAGAATATAPGAGAVSGQNGPFDVVLEFSGTVSGVTSALGALDVGGTAVLAGSVAPGPSVPLDPEMLVRGRRSVRGVHNYEPRHLDEAVTLLASEHAAVLGDPRVLSTPIGLDEVPGAFAAPTAHLRTLVAP